MNGLIHTYLQPLREMGWERHREGGRSSPNHISQRLHEQLLIESADKLQQVSGIFETSKQNFASFFNGKFIQIGKL
jgi:hypothetical protein